VADVPSGHVPSEPTNLKKPLTVITKIRTDLKVSCWLLVQKPQKSIIQAKIVNNWRTVARKERVRETMLS
jgi:hypothetical protein